MPNNKRNDDQFSRFSLDDDDEFKEYFGSNRKGGASKGPRDGKIGYFNEDESYQEKPSQENHLHSEKNRYEARDYRPVRQRRDARTGFLGGIMYFVFVISVSVILACIAWMAASDILALNKEEITAEVTLEEDFFSQGTREITDEDGITTTENAQVADIDAVAKALKDAGIIEYKILFKFYAAISNTKYKIDPGTYELSTIYDYRAIVKKMQFGSDSQVRTTVTFPEGFNVHEIFRLLEENKICRYDDLIECAASYEFSTEKYPFLEGIPYGEASRLEGFLFPDTYEFYQGMTPNAAIDTFLQIFKLRMTAEILEWIESSGYSYRDIINIASMIEKETSGSEEDRRNIASVIYNRLKAGETLGVDATSIYSHHDYEGDVTEMINTWVADTSDPYNTRYNLGLPPTPISNPGIASITAALKPNSTNYYFYALDEAANEHKFFTNSTDFENFVATQSYGQ